MRVAKTSGTAEKVMQITLQLYDDDDDDDDDDDVDDGDDDLDDDDVNLHTGDPVIVSSEEVKHNKVAPLSHLVVIVIMILMTILNRDDHYIDDNSIQR